MKQKNIFYNADYQINIYYFSSCRTNLCHTNLCDLEKSCTFAANFTHNPYESITERLAWLTLLNTQDNVSEDTLQRGIDDLINENTALFIQQTEQLTPYQLNFLYAMLDGVNADFGKTEIREQYQLGTYSNIARIKGALIDKELIDSQAGNKVVFADPVFALWLRRNKR